MRANRFTATIDACVLARALSRNLILSLAEAGLFRPRWSREAIEETTRAIALLHERRGVGTAEALAIGGRQSGRIEAAFPEATVDGSAALTGGLSLPDPGDRHVLAAAILTRSAGIVTENLKDFPSSVLEPLHLEGLTTDDFIADVIDLHTEPSIDALRAMRLRFARPQLTSDEFLLRMEGEGLVQSVNLLIPYVSRL